MQNTLTVNGHSAVISYDQDVKMFRGEFVVTCLSFPDHSFLENGLGLGA